MSIENPRFVLFPEFSKKKLSVRVCNTNENNNIPVVYNSVHLRQSLNAEAIYTWAYIDKPRQAFVLSNKPPLGPRVRGQYRTDLKAIRNDSFKRVLVAAGFEEGITYFGQELVDGTTSKVYYRLPDFEYIMAENEEALRSLGVPILEE